MLVDQFKEGYAIHMCGVFVLLPLGVWIPLYLVQALLRQIYVSCTSGPPCAR